MKALKVILVTVLAAGISIGAAIVGQHWIDVEGTNSGGQAERPNESLDTLPDLRLQDLEGRQVSSSAWAGKVLVVNFWATWCPPCLSEIPRFVEAQERLRESGVQFVGIAVDRVEEVRAFVAAHPVNYPLLIATPEVLELSVRLGNRLEVLPFTLIFDRHGRRVHSQIGELSTEELTHYLDSLLVKDGPHVSRTP
ncbi:TlpA family protein disulfide reductase [Thermochromatium tepidum]|uniref:Redoxin domain-containing protein n=1 Tax=Thermochromatium tepidum ATCC 43061 TaxID=316276 RepID=A0A6I6E8Y7_THETI|nr:TlpA disulfide reductase family protein [Thermochromatium tepidum]QGU33123.1 redoxin domain-containing protein [Thermochromatium tepidum ATCC 43061]